MNEPTRNQLVLSTAINDVAQRFPGFGEELMTFLRRDGSKIVYAAQGDSRHEAFMRVKPSDAIVKQFDIKLEIPILIAAFDNLEPRALNRLDKVPTLRRHPSADNNVAVVVARDQQAAAMVRDHNQFAFPVLLISADDLESGRLADANLRSELAQLLRSVDYFDFSGEIHEPSDFFGRVDDVEAITRLAVAGQSVGIFGLRRAGKTSLMRRISEELRKRSWATPFIFLNGALDANTFRQFLVRDLAFEVLKHGRTVPANSQMVDSQGRILRCDDIQRQWIFEADALLDALPSNVALFIDETDLINEDVVGYEDEADEADEFVDDIRNRREMNRVMQQIRGLIQLRSRRDGPKLCFITAGVASSIYSQSIRFGRDNQLFDFASIRMLGPMPYDEMRDMVRALGKRSGIKFDGYEPYKLLFDEYGGHPLLTRLACSSVTNFAHTTPGPVPYHASVTDLRRAFEERGENSAMRMAEQIFEGFAHWYPEEADDVRRAAKGEPLQYPPGKHAVGFGMLDETGGLRMKALRRSTSL